ncbi:uncharacterized protein ARMOST_18088 [Armillaria ostoyae]|uniref:Uncharacterized protein n=1 Tax=Armillaria ostoyae TaxID=47428 RepID=A0A284S0U1_ARMOS|nr:uncharacterized protein ARMOST_18088 [Armillaria ostoyae]
MGPSSAADAALFLEIVCCIALARCLRFVVSMGPSSAAPAAVLFLLDGGVLDSVLAFFWFRSIGPAVPAAVLFFEIVCCNIARPWCLRLVSVIPALPVCRSSMLLVVCAYDCFVSIALEWRDKILIDGFDMDGKGSGETWMAGSRG